MESFIKASRLKIRFDTPQGPLATEDLWDLPLSVSKAKRGQRASLDDIAVGLDKQIKESATVKSFVHKDVSSADESLRMKFEIVLHIIQVRQAEADRAAEQVANATKRQRILDLLARKENEELSGKSTEELKELLAAT